MASWPRQWPSRGCLYLFPATSPSVCKTDVCLDSSALCPQVPHTASSGCLKLNFLPLACPYYLVLDFLNPCPHCPFFLASQTIFRGNFGFSGNQAQRILRLAGLPASLRIPYQSTHRSPLID